MKTKPEHGSNWITWRNLGALANREGNQWNYTL